VSRRYSTAPADSPGALKPPEVAADLRIGINACYELIRSGELRSFRIGRSIRVSREALEAFKAGGQSGTAGGAEVA